MKSKAVLWPVALIGVLGVTVAANGFILYEANRGQAALEPDYYRKAVRWDSTMAQSVRNQALGWHVAAELDRNGRLLATVSGPDGASIADARVSVEGFAIAFEDGGFAADLAREGSGYDGAVALRHPGLHELRFTVDRGPDRFTSVLRGEPGGSFATR